MPVTFYTSLSPHFEGLSLISSVVNDCTPHKTYDKFIKAGKIAEAEDIMGDILAVYEHAKKNFDMSSPKITEFFKFWGEDVYNNISFATAMTSLYIPNRIPQMLQDFNSKDEAGQMELISKTLLSLNEEQPEKLESLNAVMQKIDSLHVSSDLKYRIIRTYHNYSESLYGLTNILNDISELITEKLKPLQDKAAIIMPELEKASNGSMEHISKITNLRLQFSPESVVDVFPASLMFGAIAEALSEKLIIVWGYRLEKVLQVLNEIESNAEQSIESLRALTEKTKFEILSALLKQQLYGAELAQKLGLTGATVSHHVSELLNRGLISAAPEQTKVYYSINKPRIKEVLREIEKYFEG